MTVAGYGTAISMIEMTPTSTDEGANYTCFIDAAGTPGVNVLTKSLPVAFCKHTRMFFVVFC